MLKNKVVLFTCLVFLILTLVTCSKPVSQGAEKNIIDLISEQPLENTAYWYVASSDLYIPREHIEELVDILTSGVWEETGYIANDDTPRTIVINFNEFPEGKNADNFDYSMGTVVKTQLSIYKETCIAFNSYSTTGEIYALNVETIDALQDFIHMNAITHEELVRMTN